jgi:hypothetical protein
MALYAGHFEFTKPLLSEVVGFYTGGECTALLAELEDAEWLPATVNSHDGRVVDANLR